MDAQRLPDTLAELGEDLATRCQHHQTAEYQRRVRTRWLVGHHQELQGKGYTILTTHKTKTDERRRFAHTPCQSASGSAVNPNCAGGTARTAIAPRAVKGIRSQNPHSPRLVPGGARLRRSHVAHAAQRRLTIVGCMRWTLDTDADAKIGVETTPQQPDHRAQTQRWRSDGTRSSTSMFAEQKGS